MAQLLLCRGIGDPQQARQFLDPRFSDLRDPALLPGCTEAARRLLAAVRAGRRIVVYGDYDVDGITGAAILYKCLKLLGAEVDYYVPCRLEEGYGLNHEAVRRIAEEKAGLLVTVDCGIASAPEAATARECGLELIITDHHRPGPELPQAAAIVHPALPGGDYPFADLSGSGVALKVAWALCQEATGERRVSPAQRDLLVQATALAALGTVADVVPLVDENRVLVFHGLERAIGMCPSPGLRALLKVAALDGKQRLDAEDIAFALGPRINAAGRLGQARLAVELLVTDREDRAGELAQYVNGLNADRQTLEREVYHAAHKQARQRDPHATAAVVVADRGWHPGVLGIVAGRLAEKYHRPAILVAWDKMGVRPGVGSARSIPGFDLHAALAACGHHLRGFGGHAAAAGLTIAPERFEPFRDEFCRYADEHITAEMLTADLAIDAEVPLSAFTLETVEQLERLRPFGHGNLRPLLCTSGVRLQQPPQPLGTGGRHVSMRLAQHDAHFRTVAFGGADWCADLTAESGPLDVAFRPVINAFRGRRSVELHLVDWRQGAGG